MPQSALPAISVHELSVQYPDTKAPALSRVSFEVQPATMALVIGPNGSGKSTLLKAMLGLLPYTGEVLFQGQPLQSLKKSVGYVPQRFQLDVQFPITVTEFLTISQDQPHRHKLEAILEQVSMTQHQNSLLTQLSGGQLQRVLLARALVNSPKILLLDEPEAGIDVGGEQLFYDVMQHLISVHGVTAIIASHELDVVYTYADQVICINQELICAGKPTETLDQHTFEKLYGRQLKFYGHHHHGTHHHESH